MSHVIMIKFDKTISLASRTLTLACNPKIHSYLHYKNQYNNKLDK